MRFIGEVLTLGTQIYKRAEPANMQLVRFTVPRCLAAAGVLVNLPNALHSLLPG